MKDSWSKSSDKKSNQWSAAKAGEWKTDDKSSDKSPSKLLSDSKYSKRKDSKSWSTDKRDTKWSSGTSSKWNKDDESRDEWPSKKYSKDSKSWSSDKRESGKWDKSS